LSVAGIEKRVLRLYCFPSIVCSAGVCQWHCFSVNLFPFISTLPAPSDQFTWCNPVIGVRENRPWNLCRVIDGKSFKRRFYYWPWCRGPCWRGLHFQFDRFYGACPGPEKLWRFPSPHRWETVASRSRRSSIPSWAPPSAQDPSDPLCTRTRSRPLSVHTNKIEFQINLWKFQYEDL